MALRNSSPLLTGSAFDKPLTGISDQGIRSWFSYEFDLIGVGLSGGNGAVSLLFDHG
jgi:hypothetical protein